MLRNLIIQILFLAVLAIAVVFWGGVSLLVLSAMAISLVLASLFLLWGWGFPKLPARLWVAFCAVVLWSLVCLLRSDNGVFGWKVFTAHVLYLISFLCGVKIFCAQEGPAGPPRSCGSWLGRHFLGIVCAVGMAVLGYGYYRFYGGIESILGMPQPAEYAGRMSGTFVSPNHFADFALVISILLAGFALSAKNTFSKILFSNACVLGLVAVMLSGSRIGLGACLFGLGLLIFTRESSLSRRAKLLAGLLAAGLLLGSLYLPMGGFYRLLRGLWFSDPGMAARTTVWIDALSMALARPLAGYGLGNFQWYYPPYKSVGITRRVDFAHSDILQTWVEQGLIGLVLWAVFLFFCLWEGRKTAGSRNMVAMRTAVVAIMAVAVLDFPFQVPAIGMTTFALLGGLTGMGQKQEMTPMGAPRALGTVIKVLMTVLLLLLGMNMGKTMVGQVYALQGERARKILDWDTAMEKFQKSTAWNPRNSLTYKGMGEVSANRYLFSRKAKDEAGRRGEVFFRRSLQINKRDGTVWLALGLLLMERGQPGVAKACMETALRLDPKNGFFHDMIGKYLITQGRFQEAKAHLEMALWLYPKDHIARSLLKKIARSGRAGS